MVRLKLRWLLLFSVAGLIFVFYPIIWLLTSDKTYALDPVPPDPVVALPRNEPHTLDSQTVARRETVRQMMQHAWKGYADYAWGFNEVRPLTRQPFNQSVFGTAPLGVTIIDSLDTLLIMKLTDEYAAAREWVELHFKMGDADASLSFFEVNIRLLGGLLSAHALTDDELYYRKAIELGERLLPAFDTVTGFPNSQVNIAQRKSSGGTASLAEWGTLSLEWNQLAHMSGSESYSTPIRRVYGAMRSLFRQDGLFPVRNRRPSGNRTARPSTINDDHFTLGGSGDSFYEYLLKSWLQSGGRDIESRRLYLEEMDGVEKLLVKQSGRSSLTYLANIYLGVEKKMDHLACFAGGMFALGGATLDIPRHVELGAALTKTCHESYDRTKTKLGPEAFRFNDQLEAEASSSTAHYILRPEVVESYFVLWRITHDNRYREWGWQVVEALERHCRVDTGGYSGLKNVYDENSMLDDVQQSFFLAETLKYLYLLFSDDSLIDLNQWVFNTEAHPLPIHGPNEAKRHPRFRPLL